MSYSEIIPNQCSNTSCPMHRTCSRVCTEVVKEATNSEGIDFLFVGDYPGVSEFKPRKPFLGIDGKILRNSIPSSVNYALTYVLRAWPVNPDDDAIPYKLRGYHMHNLDDYYLSRLHTINLDNVKLSSVALENCLNIFKQELQILKPKTIVLMGNTALNALFPRENRSINSLTGTFLSFNGIPVRVIWNPTAIQRNPAMKTSWQNQLKSILTGTIQKKSTDGGSYTLLKTVPEALDYIDYIKNLSVDVAVDTETESLNKRYNVKMGTIQFCESVEGSVMIPFHHAETPFTPDELTTVKNALFELFSKPSKIKHWVLHNAKFDNNVIRAAVGSAIVSAPIFDTQSGAFLLDENRAERAAQFTYGIYTLKQLSYDYLNFDGYNKGILAVREEGSLMDLPLENLVEYGCLDTTLTLRLMQAELEEARSQNYTEQFLNMMYYFYSPLIQLFSDIEYNGFPIDIPRLRTLVSVDSALLKRIAEIYSEIKTDPFVVKANNQLLADGYKSGNVIPLARSPWIFDFAAKGHPQKLFFEVMQLPTLGPVGASGSYSVDKNWQAKNEKIPQVAKYIEWSLMRKMYDSFAKSIYEYVNPLGKFDDGKHDGRVRPSYLLSSVVSGRIACRNPNLQACLTGDTIVITKSGMTNFELIKDNGSVFSNKLFEHYNNKFSRDSEIYKIKTKRGYTLKMSPDHIHLVLNNECQIVEKKTIELLETDHLISSLEPWVDHIDNASTIDTREARFWGYMISEGYLAREYRPYTGRKKYIRVNGETKYYETKGHKLGSYTFCNTDKEIIDDFLACLEYMGFGSRLAKEQVREKRPGTKKLYTVSFGSVAFYSFLKEKNLNKKSDNKVIPDFILQSSKEVIVNFLRALFSGDGGVNKKHYKAIEYYSNSQKLVNQVRCLLLGFGIPASMKQKHYMTKRGKSRVNFRIVTTGKYVDKFHSQIGFIGKRNLDALLYQDDKFTSQNYDTLPNILVELRKSNFKKHYMLWKTPINQKSLTIRKIKDLDLLSKVKKHEPDSYLIPTLEFVNNHKVEFVKIVSIEKTGVEKVFDITVPSTGLFWANGIITHNCPRAENEAKKAIKDIFSCPKGWVLNQLDFKAAEMRWVTIVSKDLAMAAKFNEGKAMIDAYRKNPSPDLLKKAEIYGDIHRQTAASAFKVSVESVTKDQRQKAKGCLRKGTLTLTKRGLIPIEDVVIGDFVHTGKNWTEVTDLYRPQEKVFRINTDRGYTFDVSESHEILVFDKEKNISSFKQLQAIDLNSSYIEIRKDLIDNFSKEEINKILSMFVNTSEFNRSATTEMSYEESQRIQITLVHLGIITTRSEFNGKYTLIIDHKDIFSLSQPITSVYEPFLDKIESINIISQTEETVYDLVLKGDQKWFVAGGAVQFDCAFGILYDSSEKAVAEKYGMTEEEAHEMFETFFTDHYKIREWKERVKWEAANLGYVEMPHGRRRRFSIFSIYKNSRREFDWNMVPKDSRGHVAEALRQASNNGIQGISSDGAMIGAFLFADYIRKNQKKWQIINAVHDSCVYISPKEEIVDAVNIADKMFTDGVMEYMNAVWGIDFIAPIEVDHEYGTHLGSLKKWDLLDQSLIDFSENYDFNKY